MPKVITVLEGRVPQEKSTELLNAYEQGVLELEDGIEQTYLSHSLSESDLWRIVTVWRDMDTLQAMRRAGGTPRGVLFFRAAGVEPQLSLYEVPAFGGMSM